MENPRSEIGGDSRIGPMIPPLGCIHTGYQYSSLLSFRFGHSIGETASIRYGILAEFVLHLSSSNMNLSQ